MIDDEQVSIYILSSNDNNNDDDEYHNDGNDTIDDINTND